MTADMRQWQCLFPKEEAIRIVNRLVARTDSINLETFHPGSGLERVILDPDFWEQSFITWDWGAGVALAGLIDAEEFAEEGTVFRTIARFVRYWANKDLPSQTVNSTIPYYALLWLGRKEGNEADVKRAEEAAEFCLTQARFCSNGLWNHTALYFDLSEQIWIDSLYMAGLFLLRSSEYSGERVYADQLFMQAIGHMNVLFSNDAGLFYHGFHATENHYFSAVFWGRGNSWMALILAEMLASEQLLEDQKAQLLPYWRTFTEKLLVLHDGSGLWHTVLSDPLSPLEASCTAGFAKAFLLGWRSGMLDDRFRDAGLRAVSALRHYVSDGGDLFGTSAGTGIPNDPAEYAKVPMHHIQPWGQGLALQAFSEYIRCFS